jgi:hypothetical protein
MRRGRHDLATAPKTARSREPGPTQLRDATARLEHSLDGLHALAAGGTAVGTRINAPDGFGEAIAAKLAELTGLPLQTAPNKFAAHGSPPAPALDSTSCACPRTSPAPRSCPARSTPPSKKRWSWSACR